DRYLDELRRLALRERQQAGGEPGVQVCGGGDVRLGPDRARAVTGRRCLRLRPHAALVTRLGPDQAGTAAGGTVLAPQQPLAVTDDGTAGGPAGLEQALVMPAAPQP